MELPERNEQTYPRPLAEGLWVLGAYHFNTYLVQGEQASALVEATVSAVVDEVIRQLEALRIRPTFLVVTHPHSDHVTGLAALQERFPQALVIAADGAADFLNHPKAVEALVREDRHMSEFLARHGVPPGRPPVVEPPSLQNCLFAADGDTMDLGGRTLRFLATRGHALGSIAVHIPEVRALLLSDSLGFRFPGRGVFPLFLTDYAAYTAALDRLESLTPTVVGVAHQGPVVGDEVAAAFRDSREAAEGLRARILADPRDADEVAAEIFSTYYREELTMYTPENIMNCARLLVKRARA